MSVSQVLCEVEPTFTILASLDETEAEHKSGSESSRPQRIAEKVRGSLFRQIVEKIATEVFDAAREPDDVLMLLDDLLVESDFRVLRKELARYVSFPMVRKALTEGYVPAALVSVAGTEFASRLERAVRFQHELMRLALQLLAHFESGAPEVPQGRSRAVYSSVLSDPRVPTQVKQAIWGMDRVGGAILALQAACEHPVPTWLVGKLFDIWIDGAKDALRFFATAPGIKVPEDLVPKSERYDLRSIQAAHDLAERGYQDRLRAARDSDADVYPPLNGRRRD